MSKEHHGSPLFLISGDIAQPCDGREVTYFHSTRPVTMVVNVFNASSSCIMSVYLKDKHGHILICDTINHRVATPDPGSDPPNQNDVVNQQKTLAAKHVTSITVSCQCDITTGNCGVPTECVGRYSGHVQLEHGEKS
ncbi:hypothetical protein NDS46_05245 [Paenibacillus thiaminolyticus]|uniref:hypothetical protein n=1 Tax=Paenibacillus thiaminolyticus TaxID=49283 RepID=UPI002331415F|nr:hypothetical protein [Paenibacillus thiaminolyticus]WCF09307.1 hypothetical protein NDS46_05245 [Paenibacillus thiaminolyticus]